MPIIDERFKLKKTIESIRKDMIRVGIQEGLTSNKAISISQKLDRYITEYQTFDNQKEMT